MAFSDRTALLEREKYLHEIATFVDRLDPRLAQFYRMTVKDLVPTKPGIEEPEKELTVCVYCSSPLTFGQYSARLVPRLRFTPRISKLLQKYSENPRSLGYYQQKLVRDYKNSRNKMEVTCFLCKKKWKLDGQSCTKRLQQKEEFATAQQLKERPDLNQQGEEENNAVRKKKKKRKRQKVEDEDRYAGLNIDVMKKRPVSEDTLQSEASVEDTPSLQTATVGTKAEKADALFIKTDISGAMLTKSEKNISESKLQLLEKVKDDKLKTNFLPQNITDKKRKKQRFVSKLSGILKKEKEREKSKETEEGKGGLQAFLSSL